MGLLFVLASGHFWGASADDNRPKLLTLGRFDGVTTEMHIEFEGAVGSVYAIERVSDLNSHDWRDAGVGTFVAEESMLRRSVNVDGMRNNQFFRVLAFENIPVLPESQGFGVYSSAGRGGSVLRVTNLNSSGPGSLRDAIEADGVRNVIFDVSGVIDLEGDSLVVDKPYIRIAGQTAPSLGITIIRGELAIETHDVVIQHLSIRPGDNFGELVPVEDDTFDPREKRLTVHRLDSNQFDEVTVCWDSLNVDGGNVGVLVAAATVCPGRYEQTRFSGGEAFRNYIAEVVAEQQPLLMILKSANEDVSNSGLVRFAGDSSESEILRPVLEIEVQATGDPTNRRTVRFVEGVAPIEDYNHGMARIRSDNPFERGDDIAAVGQFRDGIHRIVFSFDLEELYEALVQKGGLDIVGAALVLTEIPSPHRWEPNGIRIGGESGREVYNVVIDHCSITWAIDENVDISGKGPLVHDVTISNCIIAEGLSNATHSKGEHSRGVLITDNSQRIAIMRNLFAHNHERNPLISRGTSVVVANNVIYNPGPLAVHVFETDAMHTVSSIVGNVLVLGPDTHPGIRFVTTPIGIEDVYLGDYAPSAFESNLIYGLENSANLVFDQGRFTPAARKPIWSDNINLVNPALLIDWVIEHAGSRPADRNEIDDRIIESLYSKVGAIIDSQDQVGGYPAGDSVRYFNQAPSDADGDFNKSGYTNLEMWLNQLATRLETTGFP